MMTPVRWLDERQQRAWRSYLRMHGQLTAALNRQLLNDSELSLADFEVLVALTDTPEGRVRVTRLAGLVQWEQSRLSHHLTRMQRRGLVAREECAEDGRGWWVVLTDDGRRAIELAAPAHVELVRRVVFDGLDDDQVEVLTAISEGTLSRLADE